MSDRQLEEISKKLDVLIALSLRLLVDDREIDVEKKRKKGVGEQARYLASFGLDSKDVAKIIGAPLTSIRTLLTPSKKK